LKYYSTEIFHNNTTNTQKVVFSSFVSCREFFFCQRNLDGGHFFWWKDIVISIKDFATAVAPLGRAEKNEFRDDRVFFHNSRAELSICFHYGSLTTFKIFFTYTRIVTTYVQSAMASLSLRIMSLVSYGMIWSFQNLVLFLKLSLTNVNK